MKISIITAVFNRKQYLEETILSVLNQTYENIEYIVIDGESVDGSLEIIKKYEDRIERWISEKDLSMYDAINKGMKIATGDYILNLNSDDRLFDEKVIENVVSKIRLTKNPAYFGNIIRFYQETGVKRQIMLKAVKFKELLLSEHCSYVPHSSLFVSRAIINELGSYDLSYRYASDFDFILRILKQPFDIEHIPIFIAVFREHGNSITSSGKIDSERKDILIKYGINEIWLISRFYHYYKNWIFYKIRNLV